MSVKLLAVACLFYLIFLSDAEAQLTFSTGWGKRSQDMRIRSSSTDCSSQSTSSFEQLLKLYTFIQVASQKKYKVQSKFQCKNLNITKVERSDIFMSL